MDCWEKFEKTILPPTDAFHSRLNMKSISDHDYKHAQQVWNTMEKIFWNILEYMLEKL